MRRPTRELRHRSPENRTVDSDDRSAHSGTGTPDTSAVAASPVAAPAFRFCFGGIAEGPPAFMVRANPDAAFRAGHDRFGSRGGDAREDPIPIRSQRCDFDASFLLPTHEPLPDGNIHDRVDLSNLPCVRDAGGGQCLGYATQGAA